MHDHHTADVTRTVRGKRGTFLCLGIALVVLAGIVTGCSSGGGSGGGGGSSKSSAFSVAPNTILRVVAQWAVYIADEATTGPGGTDLNGDGDVIDGIAVALQLKGKDEYSLNVAAIDIYLVAEEVYVVTDEALDSNDWNGDGMEDDIVLLHWNEDVDRITFIDTLGPGPKRALASASRLYYITAEPTAGAESNIRYLRPDNATTPVPVISEDGMPRSARLLTIDEQLLAAHFDETVEGEDLNGDADMNDAFILALLDTTDPSAQLLSTGFGIAGLNQPFRACAMGTGDWLVGFLASEAAHADLTGGGFNDPINFSPSWQPAQCVGDEDMDLADNVLHYIRFSDWKNDPVNNPPVNTGLVGRSTIAISDSNPPYIATVSRELDEGMCDLNQDGDRFDDVVRWTRASDPVLPFTTSSQIYALADTAGGTGGIGELEFAFFIAVSEEDQDDDIDGDGETDWELLAWMDPEDGNGAFWTFDHDEGAGEVYVGTDWMAESADKKRLLSTFQEEVFGAPINTGDNDLNDSIPTWAFIDSSDEDLDFPGENIAAEASNAGMVLAEGFVFYRVNEADDNRDWNNDGDRGDSILFRTHVTRGSSTNIGTLNALNRPAIETGPIEVGIFGGVYIANEGMADKDYNKDDDKNDYVIRYFKI